VENCGGGLGPVFTASSHDGAGYSLGSMRGERRMAFDPQSYSAGRSGTWATVPNLPTRVVELAAW
jgi:hypothetical protein